MSLDVGRRCPICGATHQPGWVKKEILNGTYGKQQMGLIRVIDCRECGNLSELTRWV